MAYSPVSNMSAYSGDLFFNLNIILFILYTKQNKSHRKPLAVIFLYNLTMIQVLKFSFSRHEKSRSSNTYNKIPNDDKVNKSHTYFQNEKMHMMIEMGLVYVKSRH